MRISVTALAVLGALVLAGCSSTQDPPTPNTTSPTASQTQDPTTSGNAGQGTPSAGDGVDSGASKPSGTAVQPVVGSPANNPSPETFIPQWFERISINGTPLLETDVEIIDADDFTKVPHSSGTYTSTKTLQGNAGWNEKSSVPSEHFEVFQWRNGERPNSEFMEPSSGVRVGFEEAGEIVEFPATLALHKDPFARSLGDVISTPTHIYWIEEGGTSNYAFDWRLFGGSVEDRTVKLLAASEELTKATFLPHSASLSLADDVLTVTSYSKEPLSEDGESMLDYSTDILPLTDYSFSLGGKLKGADPHPRVSAVDQPEGSINYLVNDSHSHLQLFDAPDQEFDIRINQKGLTPGESVFGFTYLQNADAAHSTWIAQESAFVYSHENDELKIFTFGIDSARSAEGQIHNLVKNGDVIEISHLLNSGHYSYYAYDLGTGANGRTIVPNYQGFSSLKDGKLVLQEHKYATQTEDESEEVPYEIREYTINMFASH